MSHPSVYGNKCVCMYVFMDAGYWTFLPHEHKIEYICPLLFSIKKDTNKNVSLNETGFAPMFTASVRYVQG